MKQLKRIISVVLSLCLVITSLAVTPIVSSASISYEQATALDKISTENWMRAIRGETKLTEITIPGTHDSCTTQMANSIVAGIAQCQSLTIPQQLDAGVRFLDIRCEVDPNSHSVWTVHSTVDCYKGSERYFLDYVFQDIYSWLDNHPSETVLVSIKEDDGDVGAPTFTSAIYEYIHGAGQGKLFYGTKYNYKDRWYLGKTVPTLDSVRGKCVLMNRFDQVIYSSGSTASEEESGQKIKWGNQGGTTWEDPVYDRIYNANTGVGYVYVQDHYEWSTENKVKATQQMLDLPHNKGQYYINFTSTTIGTAIPNPGWHASEVNAGFVNLNFTPNKPSGIMVMDFITPELARYSIKNNEAVSCLSTGTDGNIVWSINRLTGTLELKGVGKTSDFSTSSSVGASDLGTTAPWGDQQRNSVYDYNTDLIKSIYIGEGITSIGNYAFYGFDNVEKVTIAKSVKSIGSNAFANCSSLKSVDIGKASVETIGDSAFQGCSALTSFITTTKVNSIGANAFDGCKNLVITGASGIYSESYANSNNITYNTLGAYNSDTDWFTSKNIFYEPFDSSTGGTVSTSSIVWKETVTIGGKTRNGVLSFTKTASKCYVNVNKPLIGKTLDGVTISYFRASDNANGIAFTLAQSASVYLVVYDNGNMLYVNGASSFSYNPAETDAVNNKWQYFSISVDKDRIKLYVDGNLQYDIQGSQQFLDYITSSKSYIFYGSFISTGTSNLYLDDFSVLPVAVTDDEAKAMAKSYQKPVLIESDQITADSNISIIASNGYPNVIYTHGRNQLSTNPLNKAQSFMFKGDEIADGNNDGAYYYTTSSAGAETELFTTVTLNANYELYRLSDNYGNVIGYDLYNTDGLTNTYKLKGYLSTGYADGSDEDLTLTFSIRKRNGIQYTYYNETKYVHVTTHPVSAGAASAIYKTANNQNRDAGVYLKAVGSTGVATGEKASNYAFVHTPAFVGNGWCFAANGNADKYLNVGDGKRGDDRTSSSLNNSNGADVTVAGVYNNLTVVGNINAENVVAQGTTANYYIDKSLVKNNAKIGGVQFGSYGNSYTIDTFVTRLAPNYKESEYYWHGNTGISSSWLSWDTSVFTKSTANLVGCTGANDITDPQQYYYLQPKITGYLSNGSQTATIKTALQASSTQVFAESRVDINVVVFDKSALRNLVNECENVKLTGKGVATDVWEKYNVALKDAYDNLNDYKNTTVLDENSSVYKALNSAFREMKMDSTAYNNAVKQAVNAINGSADRMIDCESKNNLNQYMNSNVSDQTNIDILTGKILFTLRFATFIDLTAYNAIASIANDILHNKADYESVSILSLENVVNNSNQVLNYSQSQQDVDNLVEDIQNAINDVNNAMRHLVCYYQIDYNEPQILVKKNYPVNAVVDLDATSLGFDVEKWTSENDNGDYLIQRGGNATAVTLLTDMTVYCYLSTNYQNDSTMHKITLLDINGRVADAFYIKEGSYNVSVSGDNITINGKTLKAKRYPFYSLNSFSISNGNLEVNKDIVIQTTYNANNL